MLTLAEPAFGGQCLNDKIMSISYNPKKRILSGGTKNGHIVLWKCKTMSAESPSSSEGWEAKPPFKLAMPAKAPLASPELPSVTSVEWGGSLNIMAAMSQNCLTVLNQTVLKKKMKENFKIMQCSNKAVEVRLKNEVDPSADFQIVMTLGMNIKGIDCSKNAILFWNGKHAQIYEL